MAWYGVNFVLGTGLHSYGFGSGGYAYVGGFVTFEVLVIVAALFRRRSEVAKGRSAGVDETRSHSRNSAPLPLRGEG